MALTLTRRWLLAGFASRFAVGDGIGDTSLRRDVGYLETTMSFRLRSKEKVMEKRPVVAVAGANGDLGRRIARALVARGARTLALVRPGLDVTRQHEVEATGAELVEAEPLDVVAMADAVRGAACVVSALNGLREAMIDRQGALLDAAVRAGVPRFVPSDFAADFTRTPPGRNRNYDLRRDFMARVDQAPIRATSIFNGAFMDMLGAEMPILLRSMRRVLYWRDVDQPLDFTTKDDTAAYAAAAALDPDAPRTLKIAGDTVSARDIAATLTGITGRRWRPLRAGGLRSLGAMIRVARLIAPGRAQAFPPWQGMQYMRDQFSGIAKLHPLDNRRYPDLTWRSIREHLQDWYATKA